MVRKTVQMFLVSVFATACAMPVEEAVEEAAWSPQVYNGLVKLDTKFAKTRGTDRIKIYDKTTKDIQPARKSDGGASRHQGRQNSRADKFQLSSPPDPDRVLEKTSSG